MMKMTSFQKAGEECWGVTFNENLFDRFSEILDYLLPVIKDNRDICTDSLPANHSGFRP